MSHYSLRRLIFPMFQMKYIIGFYSLQHFGVRDIIFVHLVLFNTEVKK